MQHMRIKTGVKPFLKTMRFLPPSANVNPGDIALVEITNAGSDNGHYLYVRTNSAGWKRIKFQ